MMSSAQVVGGRMQDVAKGTKAGPTPRLADGHPDLGNGKGAWNPRTVVNLSEAAGKAPRAHRSKR
ncbi:MAG: hypothetical protein WDO18_18405 [Acidobacteriota bacterium]